MQFLIRKKGLLILVSVLLVSLAIVYRMRGLVDVREQMRNDCICQSDEVVFCTADNARPAHFALGLNRKVVWQVLDFERSGAYAFIHNHTGNAKTVSVSSNTDMVMVSMESIIAEDGLLRVRYADSQTVKGFRKCVIRICDESDGEVLCEMILLNIDHLMRSNELLGELLS